MTAWADSTARLDYWRFGSTVALIVSSLPVQRFRQVKP
jgi:hypothetical protein